MQLYDLLYIIPAPNTEKDVEKIVKTIQKNIKELKGEIIKEDNLGNKKLAYPIEKKETKNNIIKNIIIKISEKKKKKKKKKIKKEEKQEKEEESNKIKKGEED